MKLSRSMFAAVVLIPLLGFSMSAELWSESSPILMRRDGVWRAPVFQKVRAEELGITDSFVVDYRILETKDVEEGKNSFYFFPLNRWGPFEQTSFALSAPSPAHWLGTDSLGRDVFARLLYGLRVSILYGILFWFLSFTIGILIGGIQGYLGGRVDFAVERGKELGEIIPFLSAVILVNGLTHSDSFFVTLLVVVALSWFPIASQVRAQVLSLRRREFIESARALGAGTFRILFKHLLPNALTPVIALTPFAISAGIALLATLDYLGFGLNPPTPSLGELLSQGRIHLTNAPWLLLVPTILLAILLLSINLAGESLRKAMDPKSRSF